jgi:hypothetical protein
VNLRDESRRAVLRANFEACLKSECDRDQDGKERVPAGNAVP